MSTKRQADTELNKDNADSLSENVVRQDNWKRAPDDILATRKILKVSDSFGKPTNTESSAVGDGFAAYAKVNPFASMGPPQGFTTSKSGISTSLGKDNDSIDSSISPKANPFGAPNPAHNPFMNFIGDKKPNVDYWQKLKEPIKVDANDASKNKNGDAFVRPDTIDTSETTTSGKSARAFSSKSSEDIPSVEKNGTNEVPDVPRPPLPSSEQEIASANAEGCSDSKVSSDSDVAQPEDEGSTTPTTSEKKTIDTAAMFNKPVEVDNGEANEDCVLKLRAKLYRFAEVEKETPDGPKLSKEWIEVGTGPVRLLTPRTTSNDRLFPRIVMRREHQAGGPGTKVILNASFRSHFSISKMGERAARLTCLAAQPVVSKSPKAGKESESSEREISDSASADESKSGAIPMTYLFKMQHSHEVEEFIKKISGFQNTSKTEEKA